ncbi:MAG: ABC transporter ATP-binding protein [Candidatus Poribacteria bacterium]|nr:ABC transporter ATP-binding protein [Candidatus Poribacteria bacterium]
MLDVQNLSKSIDKKPFLSELTFQVAAGESLILLGRNGAGKTLLLNILATLVEPTSGSIFISGIDAFSNLKQVRPQIGYIPVAFEGYPELSAVDYLNFFAAAYKLEKQERIAAIDAVLELMDVQHLRDIKIETFSTGERQRLLFAKTFLHEPDLWLLDEPLTPLDPRGQIEMIELFGELQAMGKTLVIATNRIEDVHKLCDITSDVSSKTNLLGILNDGKFAVFRTISQLQQEIKEKNKTENLKPNWLAELYLEVTKS